MQLKAQSAMEYLMTYGWAILIIAVVLAALFQLGVFNPNTFAPKAPPGSCQVIRPYGSGNTNYISLAGTCNNQLPQYVAHFNGVNAYAYATTKPVLATVNTTVSLWMQPKTLPATLGMVSFSKCANGGYFFTIGNGASSSSLIDAPFGGGSYITDYTAGPITQGQWQQVAFTAKLTGASSAELDLYINGALKATHAIAHPIAASPTNTIYIGQLAGACGWGSDYFNGEIANVQIYNTSFSENDMFALFSEGIGGAPIDLFHLAAWWPLNGNLNDYSGNSQNAQSSGVAFTGSWATTYSAP